MLLDIALIASTGKVPSSEIEQKTMKIYNSCTGKYRLRACLRGGGRPQVGDATHLGGVRACPYNLSF